jgi:AbiU2
VLDHLLYLLALHENNAIIVYSGTLSSQIPYSHAANAFDVFQHGLYRFEIVRLCALWDRAEPTKENIPTVIELIDHPSVIDTLVEETRSQWADQYVAETILNPSHDPKLAADERDALKSINQRFGLEEAARARSEITKAIGDARDILSSERLAEIMNLRDRHLAHSLSETRREKKTGPIPPMKYGDERDILLTSLPIVEALHCWVNGKSFAFANSQEIARKNAEALWGHCTFDIQR